MTATRVTGVFELDLRLEAGEVLVLDGGMGTELEARGVPMDREAWSAVANLGHLDVVEQAHVDFLEAGADVLIANTFAAGYFSLEAAGLSARFEEINHRAMEAAFRARDRAASDRPDAVAGSISPMSVRALISGGERGRAEVLRAHRRQAEVLADAGADLIVTEMIQSAEWHGPAVEAATATGLPTWLGVSGGPKQGGVVPTVDFPQLRLEDVVSGLAGMPLSAVAIMHTDVDDVDEALDVVQRHWDGAVAVYPHHGSYDPPSWTFLDMDPTVFRERARGWIDRGVQLVGGCCGIRPEHIRVLHADRASPDARP